MDKLIINTDGGSRGNPGPAGVGVVIKNAQGEILGEYKEYIGKTTNNVAEYKALILALKRANEISPNGILEIRMDSELIVKQMTGQYKIKEPSLQILAGEVVILIKHFKNVSFKHVFREQNKEADKLVNQALDELSNF